MLAVMMVATALCADRAVVAAPQDAPAVTSFARAIAQKITSNLRESVKQSPVTPVRLVETIKPQPMVVREGASVIRTPFSPFQFRLPPPAAR